MNKEEAIKKMKDSMGNWGLTQEFWEDVDSVLEQYAQQRESKAIKLLEMSRCPNFTCDNNGTCTTATLGQDGLPEPEP